MVFTGHLCSETCTIYSQIYTMYILSTYSYLQIYVCTYNVYTSIYRYIQEYTSSEYAHTKHIHVHRWYVQIFVSLNIDFKKQKNCMTAGFKPMMLCILATSVNRGVLNLEEFRTHAKIV